MSRYTITLAKGERTDDEAVLGFDPALRTSFPQVFETDDDFGTPEIWLGTLLENYRRSKASSRRRGGTGRIRRVRSRPSRHDRHAGASRPQSSIAERLGFIL